MEDSSYPDCLVLKIEEYEKCTNELDTTIYVLFDTKQQTYLLRGKRSEKKMESTNFSFFCNTLNELSYFVSFVICKKKLWTYVLYNYNNLPKDSYNITYEYLKENGTKTNELAGYNYQKYDSSVLFQNLRMLSSVFNYYK
jgi:hypothetical protein